MGFSSKIGAILAAAGSAVGLGNIWRFPTETGINGGAAFILIYVLFMIVLGAPVMLTEFTIGRYGQKDVADSFERLSGGHKGWRLMGLMPVQGLATDGADACCGRSAGAQLLCRCVRLDSLLCLCGRNERICRKNTRAVRERLPAVCRFVHRTAAMDYAHYDYYVWNHFPRSEERY